MQVENQNRRLAVLARIIHEGFYLPAALQAGPPDCDRPLSARHADRRKSPGKMAPPELVSVCFAQHPRRLSNRNHDGQGIDGRGDKPASLIETFRCL